MYSSQSVPRPLSLSRSKIDYASVDSPFNNKNATWDLSKNTKRSSSKILKTKSSLLSSLQQFKSEMDLSKINTEKRGSMKKVMTLHSLAA